MRELIQKPSTVGSQKLAYALAAIVVVLDQITKWAVQSSFELYEVKTITAYFNLVLVYNTGAAFSFLHSAGGWQNPMFIGLAIVISGFLIYLTRKSAYAWEQIAMMLVMGGAIGNVIDRIRQQKVTDFLDFHAFGWHWPAFNVADSAITMGVVLMLVFTLKMPPQKK